MTSEILVKSYLRRLRLPVVARDFTRLAEEAADSNQTYQDYLLASGSIFNAGVGVALLVVTLLA